MEINDIYKCSGKKYNGEKAIISLTSWKARVGTVGKTLFSLIKQCPGFHIVLVLSEEEFPKMCDELPEELMLFVKNELIELMFVYKNYKAFKKVLFTLDKYREVPVISADDDCIYKYNYAQELYDKWKENKDCIITMATINKWKLHGEDFYFSHGCATLLYDLDVNLMINKLTSNILKTNNDDSYLGIFYKKFNKKVIYLKHHHKDYLRFTCFDTALTINIKNQKKKFLQDKEIIYQEIFE